MFFLTSGGLMSYGINYADPRSLVLKREPEEE
jgi:hypothetical protein